MSEYKVKLDDISKFLNGYDDEKYIVNIEYDYYTHTIYKIKHNPTGKEMVADTFEPFLWMRNLNPIKNEFYNGSDQARDLAMKKHGITIEELDIGVPNYKKYHQGYSDKYLDGYRYLVKSNKSYNDLVNFFKYGGIDIWDRDDNYKDYFIILKPVEQYLIQTNKRLFKGLEEYNQVHKLVFDLETEGLNPKTSRIFQIGIKDNRGFFKTIDVEPNDEAETNAIIQFFDTLDKIKPAILAGYNSENFDFYFIEERCKILGIDLKLIVKTLHSSKKFSRRENQNLKIGNETEKYTQTVIWGYSVIDINHATKKAQAIDSSMKRTSLKYVCQYNKVNKVNRVYIPGDKINYLWDSDKKYYFNNTDGNWFENKLPKIVFFNDGDNTFLNQHNTIVFSSDKSVDKLHKYLNDKYNDNFLIINNNCNLTDINNTINTIINTIKNGENVYINKTITDNWSDEIKKHFKSELIKIIKYLKDFKQTDGKYIVTRYLEDDLWETLEVDNIYNQSTFLLSKLIPTTYSRVATMGTAGLWQLMMLNWSYQRKVAIPKADEKRDFTGGLSRLILTGFGRNVIKLDFSSLYPSIMLSHDIFPEVDITGALKSLIKYFHTERFKAKDLKTEHKAKGDLQMASFYDRKQLPLKILINSLYGALTAPHVFNWSEVDKGEMVTCIGRQYLRLMVAFFYNKGFEPVVMDTDGCNFMLPENIDNFTYTAKGLHSLTERGQVFKGLDAVIQEYNELFMQGEMALDLDGSWPSAINVKRKNYALLTKDGKIDLTGNTIKSKALEGYLEDFINVGLKLILENKPTEFINYYNETIEKIYEGKIPLSKIASVSKVKTTIEDYLNRGTDKNGNQLAKQAHMELAIKHNLKVDLGDRIYYVNNGNSKSHGDVQTKYKRDENDKLLKFKVDENGEFIKDENGEFIIDKNGEKMTDGFYAYYVDNNTIENEPNKLGEYNIPRAIAKLNKRISSLLVVFKPEIRKKILRDVTKNRKWKFDNDEPKYKLTEPNFFTDYELELINGEPISEKDQDSLTELFTPEEKEMKFWGRTQPDYKPDFWFDDNFKFYVPNFKKSHLLNKEDN